MRLHVPGFVCVLACVRVGVSHGEPTRRLTLACDDETGHAVGHAGASGQEGDAHDDIRDAQGVPDDRHLGDNTHNNTLLQ